MTKQSQSRLPAARTIARRVGGRAVALALGIACPAMAGGDASTAGGAGSGSAPASAPAAEVRRFAPMAVDSPYATGDWAGLRRSAEDAGVSGQFFFNDTYQWLARGGLDEVGKNGATIDGFVVLDFGKMGVIPGGMLLTHVRRQWRAGVNPFTGALWQVADDLDGNRRLHVDQLWYEQTLVRERLWVRAGFLDYQTLVDRNAYANSEDLQFMNLQFDNNPLLPLPIGLGAAVTIKPVQWLSLLAGAGDAEAVLFQPGFSTAFHGPARFIWFLEPALHATLPNLLGTGPLTGNYRFGMVSDPRPRSIRLPARVQAEGVGERGDDQGFYVSFDQLVFRENSADRQGLGLFGRYGFRHGDINLVSNFWSVGLSYTGLVPRRPADVLGVAVGQSIPSRTYNARVNRWADAETAAELYYSIAVTGWLTITPDIQYLSSPGFGPFVDDAIVLGLRARMSF
jgi:porin